MGGSIKSPSAICSDASLSRMKFGYGAATHSFIRLTKVVSELPQSLRDLPNGERHSTLAVADLILIQNSNGYNRSEATHTFAFIILHFTFAKQSSPAIPHSEFEWNAYRHEMAWRSWKGFAMKWSRASWIAPAVHKKEQDQKPALKIQFINRDNLWG